jgi:hypothetical protein
MSGVRSGRNYCPRTILYRTNSTINCANPIACMKLLKLFPVLEGRIKRSTALLLATWRGGVVFGAGRHGMVRVEDVERWISV